VRHTLAILSRDKVARQNRRCDVGLTHVEGNHVVRVFQWRLCFFVFFHTISQKPMSLESPNLTQKCSTMSPKNPFISELKGQRSWSRGTQNITRGCWLRLVIAVAMVASQLHHCTHPDNLNSFVHTCTGRKVTAGLDMQASLLSPNQQNRSTEWRQVRLNTNGHM